MKQVLVLFFVGTFVVTFSGLDLAWGKAHVPINKVQICAKNGVVKNVSQSALASRLERGGCRLPACDFDNVFLAGDDCDNTDEGDGFCDDPGSPGDGISLVPASTPACVNPF